MIVVKNIDSGARLLVLRIVVSLLTSCVTLVSYLTLLHFNFHIHHVELTVVFRS